MSQRIRAVAVALAMGAGAIALASPASASAGAKAPSISDVDVSPSPVVVFDDSVTATFSFTTKGAGKAELQLRAPGDVSVPTPVDLKSAPHGEWTKWTGTKSFDAKSAGRWNILAIAHGDGESSSRGSFEVKKALDTKIVDFDASPDEVAKGSTIKVSGRLLAEGKGYGGQQVTITFREKGTDAYRHITKTGTSRSGRFSTGVKAEATGWWRAEFDKTGSARGSVSDTDRVDVKAADRSSRIIGFDASPEPVDKGDRLALSGNLQVEGWEGLPGQRVAIQFKAHGSSRWEHVTSDVTGRNGRFWADARAYTSGWWRAVYGGSSGIKGSASDADWVRVERHTPPPPPEKADSRLIKFNAYPEPVKRGKYLKFKGKLQILDDGWDGHRAKIRLYFKLKGSSKWYYYKATWSNSSGNIYTKVKASKSGTWRFVFQGDSDAYGDTSGSDYVRVKR